MPVIEEKIKEYDRHLDLHRVLVFYYRIAWLYFASGQYGDSIDYLNKIINLKVGHLREDIQSYARLLHLLAHYELGNYALLEYLEKSVSRFFDKIKDRNKVQLEVLSFMRKQLRLGGVLDRKLLMTSQKALKKLYRDPYERRAFIYLNVIDWIDSKLQGVSVSDIISAKKEES